MEFFYVFWKYNVVYRVVGIKYIVSGVLKFVLRLKRLIIDLIFFKVGSFMVFFLCRYIIFLFLLKFYFWNMIIEKW